MSNIDFPNTPSNGDTYSYDGKQWTYDGEKWETSGGSKGQKGEPGPGAGDKGAKGEPGVGGSTGPSGTKGEKGESGPQGAVGPQGSSGAQGVAGPTGPQGVAGGTFVGARARPSGNITMSSSGVELSLQTSVYDSNSSISGNVITVPNGVAYAEFIGGAKILKDSNGANDFDVRLQIHKNNVSIAQYRIDGGGSSDIEGLTSTPDVAGIYNVSTGVIPVSASDQFKFVIIGQSAAYEGGNSFYRHYLHTDSYFQFNGTAVGTTAQGDKGAKGDTGSAGPQGPQGDTGATGPTGPAGDKGDTGASGSQTLTLNSTAGQLAISGGNNVDLRQTQYLYSSTSDLPSASTYHGAIAHVHAEGALYYAHNGSWVKLANDSDAVSSSSEVTFTRDVHFDRGVEEAFGSLSGQSGTVTHNLNDGHVFYHTTPAGDFTANFTNFNLNDQFTTTITIIVNQGVTARVVSAVEISGSAQTINWQGGSAPTGTANGLDVFSFTILRNGSSYIVLGQMVDFA